MKRTRIIGIIFVLILAMLIACGCHSSNTVSQAEYDKVVEERDHYKELYESAINGNQTTDPESPEETELIVELTKENIGDYFEYIPIPYDGLQPDMFGDCVQFVVKSKLYDEGWIFRDASRDFSMVVDLNPNGTSKYMEPTSTCRSPIEVNKLIFAGDVNSLSVESVSGRIRYKRIEAMTRYVWDDFKFYRSVTFENAIEGESIYPNAQIDYPY